MSDTEWFVRPGRATDEAGICELWTSVVGRPMAADEWRWKFRHSLDRAGAAEISSTPPEACIWVAQTAASDRIIGHYGGIPRTARIGGRTAASIVAVDGMTASDFRRRGVFTALIKTAHASWRRDGVAVVLGVPNESTQRSPEWRQPLFELHWWRRILRFDEILSRPGSYATARSLLARPAGSLARRVLSERPNDARTLDAELDSRDLETLANRTGAGVSNFLSRPPRWFEWRFGEAPGDRYRLEGIQGKDALRAAIAWSVDERAGRRANIAELLVARDDEEAAVRLVAALVNNLQASGVGTVSTLATVKGAVANVLRAAGFGRRRLSFTVCAVPLDPGLNLDELRQGARWHLSGADFDVA